jgi:cardiolipin synthase
LGRILLVPIVVWAIASGEQYIWIAFVLFLAAGVSDAVDGYLAKRFQMTTELGAYLDPLADKALVVSTYLTLGWLGHIPTWLVLLVVFRDLLIVGGAIVAWLMLGEFLSRPMMVSKINTGVQLALVGLLLAELGLGLEIAPLNRALIYVAGVTTVASGFAYLFRWGKRLGQPSGSA